MATVSTARRLHHSYAEYLDVEAQTDVRHEYLEGEIYAMAGGRSRPRVSGIAPDCVVVCAVTNPSVVVEITSPSTEEYDRGEKLAHDRRVPSIEAILIVSHASRTVTVHRRQGAGWSREEIGVGGEVTLMEADCKFEVDALYAVLDGLPEPLRP